jgi:hypothetical protein
MYYIFIPLQNNGEAIVDQLILTLRELKKTYDIILKKLVGPHF